MDLVREVLDQQILDREGRKAGKVDGLLAELREDAPPRLVALEVGPGAATRRLGHRLGARLARLFPRPVRIPIEAVRTMSIDVEVDLDLGPTRIFSLERWLARHVIGRIPGG